MGLCGDGFLEVACFKQMRSISSGPAGSVLVQDLVYAERLQICSLFLFSLDTGWLTGVHGSSITNRSWARTEKTEEENSKKMVQRGEGLRIHPSPVRW